MPTIEQLKRRMDDYTKAKVRARQALWDLQSAAMDFDGTLLEAFEAGLVKWTFPQPPERKSLRY